MESVSTWVQRNCRMDTAEALGKKLGTDKLIKAMGTENIDSAHLVIYGAIVSIGILYLVGRQLRKTVPKAPFASRPRSPDPEKPTDLTNYAVNRMKPNERPPGSVFLFPSIMIIPDADIHKRGNRVTLRGQLRRHIPTCLPQTSALFLIDPSAMVQNITLPWACVV